MRTIDIKKNDANQRLDKFLSKRFKTMPKSLMYKYIRTKYIKLNGKKCDIKDMLKEGDVLTLYIKDEFFEESEQENYEFLKAPDKLDIVYEDENIILIDKKPGIIVHQDKSYHFDSLVARVQHYLYNKGAHMAYIGHPLVGDTKYGKNRKAPDNIKYQALYSYKLKFSFDTDAGILNYLNGKEFSVKEVWFAKNKHISI